MSISSISSNPWASPWAQSATSQSSADASLSIDMTELLRGGFDQPASALSIMPSQTDTTSSVANPLQSLASDIQAMLIQAQNTAATPNGASTATAATAATGGTGAVSPEQQLATDMQTLISDLQSASSSTSQTATVSASTSQTASANPADNPQAAQHHHHHHGGGDAGGDPSVTDTATASDTATQTSSATTTDTNAAVAQTFAGDIMQALQSYVGDSTASAIPSITV